MECNFRRVLTCTLSGWDHLYLKPMTHISPTFAVNWCCHDLQPRNIACCNGVVIIITNASQQRVKTYSYNVSMPRYTWIVVQAENKWNWLRLKSMNVRFVNNIKPPFTHILMVSHILVGLFVYTDALVNNS